MTSAEKLAELYDEMPNVYETAVVSHTTITVVEKVEFTDNTKTFHTAAEHGWRLGHMVPRESGNVFTFVKMEGRR